MKRALLLSMVALFTCMGQLCGTPSPSTDATSTDSGASSDPAASPADQGTPNAGGDTGQTPVAATFTVSVSVVGNGTVILDPPGGTYQVGTIVTATAIPADGWQFVGWSGDAAETSPVIYGSGDAMLIATFAQIEPVSAAEVVLDTVLFADDGQFLGNIDTNPYDMDSLANRYGTYGSPYGTDSIWNPYATYGSSSSSYSPWNAFTSTPPVAYRNGQVIAYITANTALTPRVHPNDLAILLGRADATR